MDLSDEQYLFDDNLIWSGCQVLSRVHLTTKNLDNRHVAVCTSDREGERRASLSAYTTYDGHLKCTGALNVLNRCNPCLYDTVSMLGHFMLHVVVRMPVQWNDWQSEPLSISNFTISLCSSLHYMYICIKWVLVYDYITIHPSEL